MQQNMSSHPETGQYGVPDEALRLGVHPGAGLVEQDDLGLAQHGHGVAQLALGAARAVVGVLLGVLPDPQPLHELVGQSLDVRGRHAADGRVELQVLRDRDVSPDRIKLLEAERIEIRTSFLNEFKSQST